MRVMVKRRLNEYLKLKAAIKALEVEAEVVGTKLLADMRKYKHDKLDGDVGNVTKQTHVNAVYSEAVDKKIRRVKELAEGRGEVTYTSKPYLVARFPKKE